MHSLAEAIAITSVAVAHETDEPPTVYVTPHILSQKIAGAFAQGCGGKTVQLPAPMDEHNYDFTRATKELMERGFIAATPRSACR